VEARVLNHLIAYAEHQFGDRVEGLAYRESKNGNRMDNWDVEIDILFPIYRALRSICEKDGLLSAIVQEKMLDIVRPWSTSINLNFTCPSLSDSLTGDQINYILGVSSTIESDIALVHLHRNQFDLADSCSQRALSHARLYDGEEETKTTLLCQALRVYGHL
jgi:hypothetical protein